MKLCTDPLSSFNCHTRVAESIFDMCRQVRERIEEFIHVEVNL